LPPTNPVVDVWSSPNVWSAIFPREVAVGLFLKSFLFFLEVEKNGELFRGTSFESSGGLRAETFVFLLDRIFFFFLIRKRLPFPFLPLARSSFGFLPGSLYRPSLRKGGTMVPFGPPFSPRRGNTLPFSLSGRFLSSPCFGPLERGFF